MTLKPVYRLSAVALAAFVLAVLYAPGVLVALVDPASAAANLPNIFISLYVFAVWMLAVLFRLSRSRPHARDWPAPRPFWLGWVWLALCVSYTGFEHGHLDYPAFVYEEDGIFETATAVILLICAAGLFAGVARAWERDRRLGAAVFATAAVCVLLLMEELSWGQRIFGWETPEDIGRLNAQRETNLHNMFVGFNQLIRLAISLAIATVLIERDAWLRRLDRLGLERLMPPPAAVYFSAFLIYAHVYDELFEEVVGVFLLVYVLGLRRRLTRDA